MERLTEKGHLYTEEEVYNLILRDATNIFNRLREYEDTELDPGQIRAIDKEYTELAREVKELREKVKPKKPELSGDGYADGYPVYDTWECPGCGKEYEVDYDKYDYCPECGQAIDWREENEDSAAAVNNSHLMTQEEREKFFKEE